MLLVPISNYRPALSTAANRVFLYFRAKQKLRTTAGPVPAEDREIKKGCKLSLQPFSCPRLDSNQHILANAAT